jgi:predicted nuclease of predicted toxin-antitoxin system
VKLLLDEMWSPEIAMQLRARGYDVAAVVEQRSLRGQPDRVIFSVAQSNARTIVTENVPDYQILAREHQQRGQSHAGLIFTSNRSFPRHSPHTASRLLIALPGLLADSPDLTDREHWIR